MQVEVVTFSVRSIVDLEYRINEELKGRRITKIITLEVRWNDDGYVDPIGVLMIGEINE